MNTSDYFCIEKRLGSKFTSMTEPKTALRRKPHWEGLTSWRAVIPALIRGKRCFDALLLLRVSPAGLPGLGFDGRDYSHIQENMYRGGGERSFSRLDLHFNFHQIFCCDGVGENGARLFRQ